MYNERKEIMKKENQNVSLKKGKEKTKGEKI